MSILMNTGGVSISVYHSGCSVHNEQQTTLLTLPEQTLDAPVVLFTNLFC